MLTIFSCICWPSVFFGKCLFRSSAHFSVEFFFFMLLSCMSSLYILESVPSTEIMFVNIFSPSGLSFHFVDSFLHCVKACMVN